MRALVAFIRLSRPLFLGGGFVGVALGAAVAHHSGHILSLATYLWAQALVTSFQLMVHYANDYYDRDGDAGTRRTAWSGGSGIVADNVLAPRVALSAAVVCAATGLALSLRFAIAGAPAAALLGVATGAFAWIYSAPPIRCAARGLGELDTTLVVALLVPALGDAAFAGGIDGSLTAALAAPAVAMLAMMLGVELPDAAADAASGKRTLVVRWGFARTYTTIGGLAIAVLTLLGGAALTSGWTAIALLPAAALAARLLLLSGRDWDPRRAAFAGVALYAATTGGLATVYALSP